MRKIQSVHAFAVWLVSCQADELLLSLPAILRCSFQIIGSGSDKMITSIETLQETREIHKSLNSMHLVATAAPHIEGMGKHWNTRANQFPRNQQVLAAKMHQQVIWNGF